MMGAQRIAGEGATMSEFISRGRNDQTPVLS